MYSTTHLALGLIIGKITGDYPAALLGSLIIDIDHLIPAAKEKRIFKIRDLWRRSKNSKDSSRSHFHRLLSWILISGLIFLINFDFALVFSIAYLGHLILDALDDSDYYPFYFFKKKLNIKGFIPYYSREELIFSLILFFVYFTI